MLVILPTSRLPLLVSLSLALHSPKFGHKLVALVLIRPARRHSSHGGLGLELGRIVIAQNMKKHSAQHSIRMIRVDAPFSGME